MPFDGIVEDGGAGVRTGVLAHDFNNLLGVILCASEALAQQLPEGSEGRELARLSQDAAERGAELLRRMIEASRPVDGSCDAAEAVRATARRARLAMPEGVAVEVSLEAGPLPCAGDRSDLESAILNLCVNAGHAMPDGGELAITGRREGKMVALSVRDTGVGMSPKVLAQATDPWFTTRPGRGGAGLGLSGADAFARRCGGRLALASRKGRGTTATLYLPFAAD
jgi:signal transduction histidine kinase